MSLNTYASSDAEREKWMQEHPQPKAKRAEQSRAWTFFWGNPEMSGDELLHALSFTQYTLFQEEYNRGLIYFGGYIYFKSPHTAPRTIMKGAIFTRASASPFYLLNVSDSRFRTDGPWEQGTYPHQGQGRPREPEIVPLVYAKRTIEPASPRLDLQ